jgi:tight adherence protein B
MGAGLGLLLGLGLAMVAWSLTSEPAPPRRSRNGWAARRHDAPVRAGLEGVTVPQLVATCLGLGVVGFLLAAIVSRSVVIGAAFAWPDVVDDLASAVRAGLSLPEALAQLAQRGPERLRPAFGRFADGYRASGRFSDSVDRLKASLADPVADRVVETLRLAREVGGSDLGRLLRTLSAFLREDARTRGELESRQAWAVNAARLAVAAPWLVLALLSLRPEAVEAYDSTAGLVVLATGGALSVVAYRLMVRIGRLPREERVLR